MRLSRKVLASYSGLSLPLAAMSMPIAVYLPPFYGEGMGLSLQTVGLIFMLARIWDVVTDPIMGWVVDRYETRWGRRKHWIAISLPLLMLAIYMVFVPEREAVSGWYLGGWLLLLYIGYTMTMIAHQSWGAELATSYDERSRLFGWREIAVLAGMTLVLAVPAGVEMLGTGSTEQKVASMGYFCLLLLPITALPLLLNVPDRAGPQREGVDWRESLRLFVSNATLGRLLIADLTTGFASTASGTLYIFMATYVFELPEHASLALLFYFVSAFLAMPLWLKLAYRFGKDRAIRIALVYGATVKVALLFVAAPGDVVMLWVYTIVYGVAFGAAPTLLRSMMADLTDDDELRSGERRAGMFFALLTTTNKLGSALAVGVALTLVEWVGFAPGSDNTAASIDGLLFVYCALPFIALAVAYFPLIRYPLNRERHEEIRKLLEDRNDRPATVG